MPKPSKFKDRIVRPCFQQDLETVQIIYAHYVTTNTCTFEIEPPSLDEITTRWSDVVTNAWPYLVISPTNDLTRVLGFAYARPFRDRAGYAHSFEDAIYVAPNAVGDGVGKQLLAELLIQLRDDGVREVFALIGDSANLSSIGLHERAGFNKVGVMARAGVKFGRDVDVVIMQRSMQPTQK